MRQERIQRRPTTSRRTRPDSEVAVPSGPADPADTFVLAAADELLSRIAAALRE